MSNRRRTLTPGERSMLLALLFLFLAVMAPASAAWGLLERDDAAYLSLFAFMAALLFAAGA